MRHAKRLRHFGVLWGVFAVPLIWGEVRFNVTGGALAGDYGSQAGVLLADSGFDDDWSTAFSNTGNGQADIAPPVPAPGAILAIGGLGVLAARRRR